MAVLNRRFPELIARGAEGGRARFSTLVVETGSGQETTNQLWQRMRGRWNIARALEKSGRYEEARDFFIMARGRAHSFRFRDWKDYQVTRAASRLVQITSTTFRLSKVYGDDPEFEYVQPLWRLVAGTVRVWKDGALQASPANYTVDVDTGIVTFASAPGAADLEAEAEFDILCRFDIDHEDGQLVHRRSDGEFFVKWDSIDIVESREEE